MIGYSDPGLVLLYIALRTNIYIYFRTCVSVCFIPYVDSKMVCVVLSFIAKVITKIFAYK